MNILIVTQYFWPESFRINDLALGLKVKGHHVTVLTGMPNYPQGKFFSGYRFFSPSVENFQGIKVLRVPLIPRMQGRGWQLALNYLSFALFASLLAPFYCRDQYDAVFVFQTSPITAALPAILLKKIKKIPLWLWVQDLWPESLSAVGAFKSARVLNWVSHLVRFIYQRCDRILVQSRGFIDNILQHGQPQEKITYYPNWAEAIYQPLLRNEMSQTIAAALPAGFLAMFAGNLGAAQSLETIIAAASKLKAAGHSAIQWIILGDGRRREWLLQQIAQQNLTDCVHWLGQHPIETMPQYFALADLLLVTLRREPIFALTIPSKVQSYLACGKPIVAALDGEGAKIINEAQAGITVAAEDAQALAQAVLQLYKLEPSDRIKLGENARQYFLAHFAREQLLEKLESWLQETN